MLPHQTQHSFQHDAGDETTVIYSELKNAQEGKDKISTQVDEKVKEAAQTAEEMQRDEGEFTGQNNKDDEESECMWILLYAVY